ncbi:MAG: ABC transporter permease [Dehalococcoidia bacterium]
MTTYIIRRLIQALVVLIIVTLVVFFVMRLLPGDPLKIYMGQTAGIGGMPEERIEKLRHEFGLDQPLVIQYFDWVGGIFQGDLGTSIFYHEDVGELMLSHFPATVHLGGLGLVVSAIFGIIAGLLAAVRRGKWLDRIVTPLTYVGITIPVFWLGILLILAFGLKLGWLPIAGYVSPFEDFWLSTQKLIMPVICYAVFGLAANARQMRSSTLEVIGQDYIRTAWAKGLSERSVIVKHAMKNSLIPVITLIGASVRIIFGGSVLIETVFAIPGVGRLLVNSIFAQDYVVVQAVTSVIAVIVLFFNLLVDISYAWLDPRIRYS